MIQLISDENKIKEIVGLDKTTYDFSQQDDFDCNCLFIWCSNKNF
jgi:hypothetical protein